MCVNACWYFDVPRIEKCEESHVAISLISFLIKNKTNYFSWPSSFSPSNRFPCFFLFVWWKTVFHSLFPNHTTREKITGTCGSQPIPVGFLFQANENFKMLIIKRNSKFPRNGNGRSNGLLALFPEIRWISPWIHVLFVDFFYFIVFFASWCKQNFLLQKKKWKRAAEGKTRT